MVNDSLFNRNGDDFLRLLEIENPNATDEEEDNPGESYSEVANNSEAISVK